MNNRKMPQFWDEDAPDASNADPGAAMDAATVEPSPELLAGEHARQIFLQLFTQCLPNGSVYRGGRRWKAGYNRMVALAYTTAPGLFVGLSQLQVAYQLKIDVRVFRRLLREVEATLQARTAATVRRTSRKGSKQ